MNNYRELLFSTKGEESYSSVLERVQRLLSSEIQGDVERLEANEIKERIATIITDNSIRCNQTESVSELTELLYHDMAEMSFISQDCLLEDDEFEELNINAWNDVDIILNGQSYKTNYSFLSPQHAIDIHKRLLRKTNVVLDDAMPYAQTDLGVNVRIACMKTPVMDEEIGIVSSIRKVNTKAATRESLLKGGSLTQEMLDFLELAARYGVSICFAGETGTGKTYLAGYILSEISKSLRTYTIEEGSREWDFIVRDDQGRAVNSVLHTKTRPSSDSALHIDQNKLLELALRFDPDVIGVGEMRSSEAYTAVEAGNTGHTILTTTHADSAWNTPLRILQLAKKAHDFSDDTLLPMIVKAFPIVVYLEQLADKKRRVTEIVEFTGYHEGSLQGHYLWKYLVEENIYRKAEDGNMGVAQVETVGHFVKEQCVSESLAQKMLKKGATRNQIKCFTESGE